MPGRLPVTLVGAHDFLIDNQAPAASNPHGDPIDPVVTLPWNFGPVDASPGSHTIDVGPLTQGPAPTA